MWLNSWECFLGRTCEGSTHNHCVLKYNLYSTQLVDFLVFSSCKRIHVCKHIDLIYERIFGHTFPENCPIRSANAVRNRHTGDNAIEFCNITKSENLTFYLSKRYNYAIFQNNDLTLFKNINYLAYKLGYNINMKCSHHLPVNCHCHFK